MPADVKVEIAEPKHGSAGVPEVSRSPEEPVHATQGGRNESVDATAILESLSPAALQKWKQTGKLPPHVDIEKKATPEVGENEKILRSLTPEQRKTWRETGELPTQSAAEGSEKSSEQKSERSEESSHPLARIEGLRTKGGADQEINVLHAERTASHKERYSKDEGKFSANDRQETMRLAVPVLKELPKGLLDYFTALQLHLEHPYQFFREFARNTEFRGKVLAAARSGNPANIAGEAVKFDSGLISSEAKERRRVTSAPAPAASIGGRATAPADESEAALRAGDFKRFRLEENRREHRKRTGNRS